MDKINPTLKEILHEIDSAMVSFILGCILTGVFFSTFFITITYYTLQLRTLVIAVISSAIMAVICFIRFISVMNGVNKNLNSGGK